MLRIAHSVLGRNLSRSGFIMRNEIHNIKRLCIVKYFKWFAKSNQRAKGLARYLARVLGAFRTHGGYMAISGGTVPL